MPANKPRFDGEWVRLDEACDLVMGQSPSSASYNQEGKGLPFYQGNADFGDLYPITKTWCNQPRKTAEAGDILISVRAPIGAVNIAGEECCIGRGLAAIRQNGSVVSRDYLFHCLQANRSKLEAMGTGSTFKAIGKRSLSSLAIPIYGLEKQKMIVKQLEGVNECLAAAATALTMFDALVKSRFVEMFGGMKYESVPMGHLVAEIVAGTNVGGKQRPLLKGEYGVLKISAVTKGVFDASQYKVVEDVSSIKMVHPRKGDLLFSRANTSEMVGATAIVDKDCACLFLPDKLWRIDPTDEVNTVFLKALLSSSRMRREISNASTGSSGSMQNISMTKFRSLPAFLPPLALQQEFAAFVAEVDKSRFIVQKQIEKLQTLYDSLAQEYFS